MQEMDQTQPKRGLKFKFLLVISLLLGTMGVLIGLTLFVGLRSSFEDQLQKRGLALANSIAKYGASAVSGEERSHLQQLILGPSHELDVVYLVLLDNEGKVIVHSDERENGKMLNDPLTIQASKTI